MFSETADSPNFAGAGAADPQSTYGRAITACFSSLRRWNPDIELTLIANRTPPAALRAELDALDVSSEVIPFAHRPPDGFVRSFVTSFFLLDAIGSDAHPATLFIDPGVVCIRQLDLNSLAAPGLPAALPMPFNGDEDVNGLTVAESRELGDQLGGNINPHVQYGGEALLVPESVRVEFSDRIERAFQFRWIGMRLGRASTRPKNTSSVTPSVRSAQAISRQSSVASGPHRSIGRSMGPSPN